jgi:hypothetical protein
VVPILIVAASAYTTPARAAAPPTQYVRVRVAAADDIYVQFRGNELRMATTVAGLTKAKPVKATPSRSRPSSSAAVHTFPEVQLPVARQQLPTGLTKASAVFLHVTDAGRNKQSFVSAKLGWSQLDANGATWTYWSNGFTDKPSGSPTGAPVIALPKLQQLRLDVKAEPKSGRQVGIVITARAGGTAKAGGVQIQEITRNGKSAQASLKVLDRNGKVAASATGALSKFSYG